MLVDAEELFLRPLRDVGDRGCQALEVAGGIEDSDIRATFEKAANNIVKEGERALKKIKPIWDNHILKHGDDFSQNIFQNDDLNDKRRRLESLLYDFEDYLEPATFHAARFLELQSATKTFALSLLDTLMFVQKPNLLASPALLPLSSVTTMPRGSESPATNLMRADSPERPDSPTLGSPMDGNLNHGTNLYFPRNSAFSGSTADFDKRSTATSITSCYGQCMAPTQKRPSTSLPWTLEGPAPTCSYAGISTPTTMSSPSSHPWTVLPASESPKPESLEMRTMRISSISASSHEAYELPTTLSPAISLPQPLSQNTASNETKAVPTAACAPVDTNCTATAVASPQSFSRELISSGHTSSRTSNVLSQSYPRDSGASGPSSGQIPAALPPHNETMPQDGGFSPSRVRPHPLRHVSPIPIPNSLSDGIAERDSTQQEAYYDSPPPSYPEIDHPRQLSNGRADFADSVFDPAPTYEAIGSPPPPPFSPNCASWMPSSLQPPSPLVSPHTLPQRSLLHLAELPITQERQDQLQQSRRISNVEARCNSTATRHSQQGVALTSTQSQRRTLDRQQSQTLGDATNPPNATEIPPLAMDTTIISLPPFLLRDPDLHISFDASIYRLGGFCPGAALIRTVPGKRNIKPGSSYGSARAVGRCTMCEFNRDLQEVVFDFDGDPNEISFEGAATVFPSQVALVHHLASHAHPLPEVDGVTVQYANEHTEEASQSEDFDVRFLMPATSPRSCMVSGSERIPSERALVAHLPRAVANKSHQRRQGEKQLVDPDGRDVLTFFEGACVVGVEFPTHWGGKWAIGWHDGRRAGFPAKLVDFVLPYTTELIIPGGVASSRPTWTAVVRWKWCQRDGSTRRSSRDSDSDPQNVGWLTLTKGEVITGIHWIHRDYWCWSGISSKGKLGLFPCSHLDPDSLREELPQPSPFQGRASTSSSGRERNNSRIPSLGFFSRRKVEAVAEII